MSVVERVLQAEREWLRLLVPDYAQVDDRGRIVGKEQVLASLRSGERGWEEAHSDEHDIRIYGNTAVVI